MQSNYEHTLLSAAKRHLLELDAATQSPLSEETRAQVARSYAALAAHVELGHYLDSGLSDATEEALREVERLANVMLSDFASRQSRPSYGFLGHFSVKAVCIGGAVLACAVAFLALTKGLDFHIARGCALFVSAFVLGLAARQSVQS